MAATTTAATSQRYFRGGGGGDFSFPGMASGRPRRGSPQREHSARRALLRLPHAPQMRK
jgi:hypothetical protein